MPSFILYGTSACHLCELAEALLLERISAGRPLAFDKVDIADDDTLFERYGLVIPVLRHPDGRELGWPFDAQQLEAFVATRER